MDRVDKQLNKHVGIMNYAHMYIRMYTHPAIFTKMTLTSVDILHSFVYVTLKYVRTYIHNIILI